LRTPSHRHFFSPGSSILLCLAKHLLAAQARAVPDIKFRRGLSGTRGVLRDTLQPNDSIDVLFFPTRAEWPLTFNSCAESTLGCGMLSLARSSGLEPLTAHCHGDPDPTRPLAQEWTRISRDGGRIHMRSDDIRLCYAHLFLPRRPLVYSLLLLERNVLASGRAYDHCSRASESHKCVS
jgi:hypothetical protein